MEEQIKQEMEHIDTLQAGIVYGKEAAWNRLQTRMDNKPQRRPGLWYKTLAAAAICCILAGVGIKYFSSAPIEQVPLQRTAKTASPATTTDRYNIQFEAPASHTPTSRKHKVYRKPTVTSHYDTNSYPTAVNTIQDTITTVVIQSVHATTTAIPVVHINELYSNHSKPSYTYSDSNPFPHVQFKLKTVHINDLGRPLRQEYYMRDIERNTAQYRQLLRRYDDDQSYLPGQLFRINLSQN